MTTYKNKSIPQHVVLSEVLGTRFFSPYISFYIKEFLTACESEFKTTGNKIEVDIKLCKFNPDNYRLIIDFVDSVDFVDSDNPIIDSMLSHNSRVSTVRKLENAGKIMIETIPTEFDVVGMYEYVSKLDRSKVYRLCSFGELNGRIPDVSILIAMSIGYLYPDVSVDLSEQANNYFRIFHKFWMYSGLIKRDSYNLLWQGNVLKIDAVRIDAHGDNIFYIPGVGEITEDTLNQNFSVIPFEFGNSSTLDDDPEMSGIFDNITNELQRLLKKKKKKKLTSELTTIGRG